MNMIKNIQILFKPAKFPQPTKTNHFWMPMIQCCMEYFQTASLGIRR